MQQPDTSTNFADTAKRRQGCFRDNSLTITSPGRARMDDKGRRNSHLLALGYELENIYPDVRNEAIDFFAQRRIKWWKAYGRGGDIKGGPTRNMASSQVACVNFMLPLAKVDGALASAIRAIDHDVLDIVDIPPSTPAGPLPTPSRVEFEWIGVDASGKDNSLENNASRGANSTSIDAFLVAETRTGRRRAYLLEWKYVEEYLSTKPDNKGEGSQGVTRRDRYGSLYRASDSSFNLKAAPKMKDFFYEPFYQLMRQRLLADRLVRDRELGVDEAKVVVVVPEDNMAYRMVRSADGKKTTSPPLAELFPELNSVEQVMRES